ncbi:MAG: hypothetical protein KGV44_05175 [Flavobacteriaceae bacterium]|nr:hypothetical protein [Flavobacteriaceae bacterium]
MKKLSLLVMILFSTVVFSQRIQKGGHQVNAGLGFSSGWGLPVYAGYDYAVTNDITVGGQLSFATSTFGVNDVRGSWFGLGVNGNYHFNNVLQIPNNFDAYAGVTLAYNNFSYNNGYSGNASGMGFAGQIGGRYFFNNKLAINVEFGGGNIASGGKVGITYKLN